MVVEPPGDHQGRIRYRVRPLVPPPRRKGPGAVCSGGPVALVRAAGSRQALGGGRGPGQIGHLLRPVVCLAGDSPDAGAPDAPHSGRALFQSGWKLGHGAYGQLVSRRREVCKSRTGSPNGPGPGDGGGLRRRQGKAGPQTALAGGQGDPPGRPRGGRRREGPGAPAEGAVQRQASGACRALGGAKGGGPSRFQGPGTGVQGPCRSRGRSPANSRWSRPSRIPGPCGHRQTQPAG